MENKKINDTIDSHNNQDPCKLTEPRMDTSQLYKEYIQSIISKENNSFCPFQKEQQMSHIFDSLQSILDNKKSQKILAACCGYGRLIFYLNQFNPNHYYHGIDYIETLIQQGQSLFKNNKNISLEVYDVLNLSKKYTKKFDITISYKTLSWLEYYEDMMREIILATKKRIYITSLFYDGDIDFITKVYENANNSNKTFSFLNTYSFPKFKRFCLKLGAKKVSFTNMPLKIDLKKTTNPDIIKTYTIKTIKNDNIEVTGTTILNWKLVEVDL